MKRFNCSLTVSLIPLLMGCQAHAQQCPIGPEDRAHTVAGPGEHESTRPVLEPTSPKGMPQGTEATQLPPDTKAASAATSGQSKDATALESNPGPPVQALPELKLKLVGMHIGGGPNDAVTKRPFIEAIEAEYQRMRACYRDAEEPMKGGSFGVDLRVEREGGKPSVQSVRTVMKGDKLRACLQEAFGSVTFGKPAKGATVLSVSVHFTMGS